MNRKNTYWVEYTYRCEYWDEIDKEWYKESDIGSGPLRCLKKDIKKEVEQDLRNNLKFYRFRNLEVTIVDQYLTTDDATN